MATPDDTKKDEDEAAVAVTGRPNDLGSVTNEPALRNSTFAARAKAGSKAVKGDDTENKSVKRTFSKRH